MTIEFDQQPQTEYQRNIEILQGGGEALVKTYELAVKLDPRLADVLVVPERTMFPDRYFAVAPWQSEQWKGEVHMPIDHPIFDEESICDFIKETTEERFIQQIYAWLGIQYTPENVSSKLVRQFVILHELGHLSDIFDNANNPYAYGLQVDQEMRNNEEKYPLKTLMARHAILLAETDKFKDRRDAPQHIREELESVSSRILCLSSKRTMIQHEMPMEQKADEFAINVLMSDEEFLATLI